MTSDLVVRAEHLAQYLHLGQVDKQGEPYIFHPFRVAASLSDFGDKVVALLHDAIEDTGIDAAFLERGFPKELVNSIVTISRMDKDGLYSAFIGRIIASGDARAIRVKLADLRDNLRPGGPEHLYQRYREAIPRLEQALKELSTLPNV